MIKHWKFLKFEEIISFSQIGIVRNNKQQSADRPYRYLKMNNIKNENGLDESAFSYVDASEEEVEKFALKNKDFLFNTRNSFELVGKTALYKSDYNSPTLFNNNILRINFKEDLLPEFVSFAFSSPLVIKELEAMKSGTTNVVGIYFKSLKNLKIPVPPLQEQQQIVQILDQAFKKIDQAIANIEQNIKNAEELFQAKLNEVFSQKGEGWEEKTLGELGKVSMCKRILKKQTTTEGGIPFYKIGTFGKEPNAFIPEEIYNEFRSKYSFPKNGDILISASGTIGRRVVYDGEPAYFQDSNIVWIDNDESAVLNEFLYEFYGVCNWNPSKGATISRLYNDDLRRIKISYPSIEEQKIIVPAIKELKEKTNILADQYRKKRENLEEFKKSLLEIAFKGELTKEEVAV